MFRLSLSPGSKSDIRSLKARDPDAAALLLAGLQEIQGNQELLDSLTIRDFDDVLPELNVSYDVKQWWQYWKRGRNLWRLRLMDDERLLSGYRVIYAFIPRETHYLVLGVVPRSFNYDPNHTITKRIIGEYDDLCA
ncbi:hypothetical protein [Aquipseudomonas alcaligenes]|uniref:hypothetical protein n=1 Tax=Aquipseudomonas alcaligenes TaxID=43263 RepID=UPI003663FB46